MLTEVNNANGSTQISKYSYTYYVDGNQKSKTESVAGTNKGTTNYTYDGLNRLVQEEAPNNTYSYQYDSYGNRSQLSVTGDENYTTNYTYDKNNRMCKQTKTVGTSSEITDFWYDPNGNQISSMTVSTGGTGTAGVGIELVGADNTSSYSEYNSWNQLTKTMQNGNTASYTYNGDGLRMSKTVNGTTTSHIWDGTNIAADVSGSTVTKYIRGLQLISSKKGSNESFYTYNGHGDVVQLTNGSGSITKQYGYDAFGVEIDKSDNDTNPFRYCGEYYDTETDSVYLRARYYKPTTGRFITEDPIRDGLNWYSYCAGEPLTRCDPSGCDWKKYIFNQLGQRIQWALGASVYLSEKKGYETAAWLLLHSLSDNPDDVYRDNFSRIAYLVNHDDAFSVAVQDAINNSNGTNIVDKTIYVAFKTGDLYYSLHKSEIVLNGHKREDGTWYIECSLHDTYDFTEIQSLMNDNNEFSADVSIGTLANDAAVLSQLMGSISPYEIYVDFCITR